MFLSVGGLELIELNPTGYMEMVTDLLGVLVIIWAGSILIKYFSK